MQSEATLGSIILLLTVLLGLAIVVFAPRIPPAREPRNPALSRAKRSFLTVMIAASLLLCLLSAGLQAGYENSPDGVRDSEGHPLGFNEPLKPELARMVLANATASSMIEALGWNGCLFLAMHLLPLAFLAGALHIPSRLAALCCWIQFFVFPFGWVSCVLFYDLLVGREIDGEVLSDFPFWWTFQVLWLSAAATAGWWLQRASHSSTTGAQDSVRDTEAIDIVPD